MRANTDSVTRDEPALAAIARDEVRAMHEQSPQGIVIGLVLGGMFVFVFTRYVGPLVTWSWYGLLTLAQLGGWHHLVQFRRATADDNWSPVTWQRRYALRVWIAGLLLGLAGGLFVDPDFGDARWLAILTLSGISAGSVTSYAYHLPTLYGFLLLLNLPLAIQLWPVSASGTWVPSAVHLFYIGMLAWFGHTQSGILTGSIRMRHKNAVLVERLREQTIALAQANVAKSQFFAAASHDLRQPLHALGYYSSLLDPTQQDALFVTRIGQCVDALDDLIEGVLDISRLDAGRINPQIAPVSLQNLLVEQQSLNEAAAAVKGLQLRVHVGSQWTLSDAGLLRRVVSNLVSNALRYTEHGGVLLAVRNRGAGYCLQVFDTGRGIPEDQLDAIFEEFVQLDNAERIAAHGVGLGLATVRRLCVLLGHPLHVRSRVGRGSCFEVHLPHCTTPPALADSISVVSGRTAMHGRILLVEDHELVRESLQTRLHNWGLVCDAVSEGSEALQMAQKNRYDVILCDWRLPGVLNGIQVLCAIQDLQPGQTLMVLLTGETEEHIGRLPENMTMLRKPIRPIRLRALITAHLQSR